MPRRIKKMEEVKVSLLPGERERRERERVSRFTQKLVGVIVVVVLLIGGTWFYFNRMSRRINNEYSALLEAREEVKKQIDATAIEVAETRRLVGEIGLAKTALGEHRATENLLTVLEETIIPEVTLTQLAADVSGALVFGVSAKDNAAAVRQILAWSADSRVKEARVSGMVQQTDPLGNLQSVEFSVTLMLNNDILTWNP